MRKATLTADCRGCLRFLFPLAFLLSGVLQAQVVDVYERPVQIERSRDFDVQHYRVTLDFDLEAKSFRGENQIKLVTLRAGWDRCRLDAEELVVDAVHDVEGRALKFSQADGVLEVIFSRTYSFGDTVEFAVVYHATDPEQGLYFDEETPEHPRMVSTDSWPNNARRWIPCYDHPHDKVTQELLVTVPAGEKVLSNGRLVGVSENREAGTATWHWLQDQPHSTYLFMLAIGPFTIIEDSLGSLPVSYWVYPRDAADAEWIFAKTPAMIEFYGELFDYPYPWAKYAQVTTPHVGGGAEATTATVLGQQVIHDRRAEQDFSWERIIAHEIAHQWFGDLVTLRTWSQTWINESFATYADYLYTNHERGPDEGAWDLKGKKEQYLREAHTRYMRPIVFDRYDRPHDNFDSHTYPKGAAVLHTLRFVMGDEPFFRALSHFLHEKAFQPADTNDFATAVKDATGQNLDWFFEQYLFHPGHAVFEISYDWLEKESELRLRVAQNQDISRGIPIYRVPVDIGIVTASGKRIERVWLGRAVDEFTLEVAERPLLVRFDEGNRLLKEWTFRKEPEELCYQARNDDVIGREWAVRELERFGAVPEAAACLVERAASDPFWAVRVSALKALRRAERGEHQELCRALVTDPSSKVRAAALRALADSRDRALLPLFRARFEGDDSYLAQAAALRGVGMVGDREDLPLLRRASALPSPRGVLKQAADEAIAEIERR